MNVVFPFGSFGESGDDDALDTMMRDIALLLDPEDRDWSSKYGASLENDELMMHRFCWCERKDCPWCVGCSCPESAIHFFVDGKEVSSREWMEFYDREVYSPLGYASLEDYLQAKDKGTEETLRQMNILGDKANLRRSTSYDSVCGFCRGEGVAASKGGIPGRSAPNFWHKPSGFKVWWYKFIGRDMETEGTPPENLVALCAQSLQEKQLL